MVSDKVSNSQSPAETNAALVLAALSNLSLNSTGNQPRVQLTLSDVVNALEAVGINVTSPMEEICRTEQVEACQETQMAANGLSHLPAQRTALFGTGHRIVSPWASASPAIGFPPGSLSAAQLPPVQPAVSLGQQASAVTQTPAGELSSAAQEAAPTSQHTFVAPGGQQIAPAVTQQITPAVTQQIAPAVAQNAPTVAQNAPAVAQNAPAVAQNAPAVTQQITPTVTQQIAPAVAQNAPAVAQNAPAVAQNAPTVAQNAPALAQIAPTVAQQTTQQAVPAAAPPATQDAASSSSIVDTSTASFRCAFCHSYNMIGSGKPRETFYAVIAGRSVGVFSGWHNVQPLVSGVGHACYKKYSSEAEAYAAFEEARLAGYVVVLG